MRRCGFVVAFAVLALGASSASARPPSLTGEVLSQHTLYTGPSSGVCTAGTGGSTSYSMDFAGTAGGAYPGTFTEHIAATVGPQSTVLPMGPFPDGFDPGLGPDDFVPAGQLLSLAVSFTVNSSSGNVTGTKNLTAVVPADPTHAGACREWSNEMVPGFGTVTGTSRDVRAFDLDYDATVTTGEGSFADAGSTDLQGRQGKATNPGTIFDVNDLGESFDSSDEDADGVPDTGDSCPTVPAATANGCPASSGGGSGPGGGGATSGPPPDADADGVPDSSDGCPSTKGPSSNGGCPVNAFSFAGNPLRRKGYTILKVKVPGPGRAKAAQAKVTKKKPALIKAVEVNATKAGQVNLTLKPTKAGKKLLAKNGNFTVKAKVTYTPTGGKPKSVNKSVGLDRRRRFHG